MKSEEKARQNIDRLLTAAGWSVQDIPKADIHAARGVAIREFPLSPGHGIADYLLHLDGKAAGVIEAKREGATLTGVEIQSWRYVGWLPSLTPSTTRTCGACPAGCASFTKCPDVAFDSIVTEEASRSLSGLQRNVLDKAQLRLAGGGRTHYRPLGTGQYSVAARLDTHRELYLATPPENRVVHVEQDPALRNALALVRLSR